MTDANPADSLDGSVASSLLTTVRSAFTSLVAGFVWLVALWVGIEPYAKSAGSGLHDVWQALTQLSHAAPGVAPAVAALLAAYLLGITSEAAFGVLARGFAVFVVGRQRWVAPHPGLHSEERPQIATVGGYLETAQGRASAHFDGNREKVREVQLRMRQADGRLESQVRRLRAEAEFRLQLIVPLPALAIAVAVHSLVPGLVILAVVLVALIPLAASANHCAERANDALADWDTVAPTVNGHGGPKRPTPA